MPTKQTESTKQSKNSKKEDKTVKLTKNDLQHFLAETFVLYMKTYALHWNYTGANFYGIHKMTEEQYTDIAEAIDTIAERIRATRQEAPFSLEQILNSSSLKEFTKSVNDSDAIKTLADDNTKLAKMAMSIAEKCEEEKDLFSHDLMVARIGQHEKFAWMLNSACKNTHH